MFWNTLMGINSFIVFPATSMFLIYAAWNAILNGQWELLGIAIILWCMTLVIEIALAIMDDAK